MPNYVALLMAFAILATPIGCIVAIVIFMIADWRGGHRTGGHRVRSQRTTVTSRGRRPYRGGRVRQ